MSRIFLIALIATFACLATKALAQEGWRTRQPAIPVQSGQFMKSDPINGARQVLPDSAAMQHFPNHGQYYSAGNDNLPPQANKANNQWFTVTRKTQFPLEFAISPEKKTQLRAVELLYSMNRGQNYYSYQTIPVTETKFVFNAPEDAEYWFVFRAIDKNGEVKEMGARPAARVLVDTVPPKMTLNAHRNPSGEVIVEWTLEDTALKDTPPTVSLSYDSNATSMTLAVDPKNVKREGNRETGYVAFWPLHDAEAVDIRCEQEDAADNKEIQTTQLVLKPSRNGNASEVAMMSATDGDTTTTVQPVPDMPVSPPPPVVLQNTRSSHDTMPRHEINPLATRQPMVASDDPLAGMLATLSGAAPSAVSADVMQPYADNFDNTGATGSPQLSAPAPSLLSTVPAPQFLPGNTLNNTSITVTPGTNAPQLTGPNVDPNAASGVVVTTETEAFPGKITGVSLGHDENQPLVTSQFIIVRWMPGGTPFTESKVDFYRSETKYGPWRPIAFDLKNTGQHYWPVSVVDQMPFYLRVDMRTTQGAFTDFTVQPIALPLSLNAPATQQDSVVLPENQPNGVQSGRSVAHLFADAVD